ncbi:hypothetical protein [uncultured Kordia sp.]|uniref:hypothetical protein n=1 Tax=uncultured Kordia sp. TaxID=507699 RepID=UPI002639CCBB|nr:hypothetical protein [uncultured Kordia sp.]
MQELKTVIKFGNCKFEGDFLSVAKGDDPNFIRNCEKIIKNRICHWNPIELFIIGIDTTFCNASIKYKSDSSDVFSFWSSGNKLRVTSYHPNIYRPFTEIFLKTYKGYEQKNDVSYIKKRKREEYRSYDSTYGDKELNYDPIDDGLIIYYTRNTLSRDEGSIMCFYRFYDEYKAILINLGKNLQWNVSESCEIPITEVQQIINI